MLKVLVTVAATTAFAAQGIAGSLVLEAPVEQEVLTEAPMGSNVGWIIPLLAIGLIAIAVSSKDEEEDNGCGKSARVSLAVC